MLKLKTVSLLGHRSELDALPKGKLLINTINAHSYNTALKDSLFMECAEGKKKRMKSITIILSANTPAVLPENNFVKI